MGHEDNVDFLVMEYLESDTLADRLAKGPLPTSQGSVTESRSPTPWRPRTVTASSIAT